MELQYCYECDEDCACAGVYYCDCDCYIFEWSYFIIAHPATKWKDIIQISLAADGGGLSAVAALDSNGNVLIHEERGEQTLQKLVKDWNLFDVDNDTTIIGDLNGDAKISISDLIILAKSLSRKIELTENQKLISDLNDDGKLNGDDLLIFIKYLVGEISSFPLQR